jgi:hypothetical protein
LISKHTVETTISPAQIWRVWEDVETWKDWDLEIEFSRLNGPFKAGTTGLLKMHNSPILRTKITSIKDKMPFEMERMLRKALAIGNSD